MGVLTLTACFCVLLQTISTDVTFASGSYSGSTCLEVAGHALSTGAIVWLVVVALVVVIIIGILIKCCCCCI